MLGQVVTPVAHYNHPPHRGTMEPNVEMLMEYVSVLEEELADMRKKMEDFVWDKLEREKNQRILARGCQMAEN